MTLPPTAYISLPVPSSLTPLNLRHQLYHPTYNNCPNGWDFNDNISNKNTTTINDITTNIFAYNDQLVKWEFDNKFTFDLILKTTTDDATDTM